MGGLWNIEDDAFGFKVAFKSKQMTMTGVLPVLSSVYDPLRFGTPFSLKGKQILQKLCEQGLKWDEELPKETAVECIKSKDKLFRSKISSHEKMLHTTNIWQSKRL